MHIRVKPLAIGAASSNSRRRGAAASAAHSVIETLELRTLLSAAATLTPTQMEALASWKATPAIQTLSANDVGSATPAGLTPAQLDGAYGISNIKFGNTRGTGSGQTIAIVDAFDDPNALSDLNAFSSYFSLPKFNSGSGTPTFTKFNENGATSPLPSTDPDGPGEGAWEVEEAQDIEWAHAAAPQANIDLVEASNTDDSLYTADATAAALPDVSVVSNSWNGSELSNESSLDPIFDVPGVTFVFAAGDYGAYGEGGFDVSADYPSTSPNVVSAGGTQLTVGSGNTWQSETTWGDGADSGFDGGGGGGISSYEPLPSYQVGKINGLSSTNRAFPDVSMDASPDSSTAVYDSYDYGSSDPWLPAGNGGDGTSLSTPLWSALIAIADQGRAIAGDGSLTGPTQTLPDLYKLPSSDFHDITTGSNGFPATKGYDLATGLGTPIANLLVPALAPGTSATPTISTTQQPATATVGASIADTATLTGGSSPTGTVTFNLYANSSASGTPLFTDTETLSGGTATSKGFTTTTAGTDYWVDTYNGDSSNSAVTSGVAAAPVIITSVVKVTPSITNTPEPAAAPVGTSIADKVTLTSASTPTGTVAFNLYASASGTGKSLFYDAETLSGGVATSRAFTTTATGTDYWVVTYYGDAKNNSVTSAAGAAPVVITPPGKADPSISTTAEPATAKVGASIADKATLTGGSSPTGTVTFKLFASASGTGTPLFTDTETLNLGVATSKSFKTTATGTDYWVDTYNGDTKNNGITSGAAAEPVVITPVGKVTPTISTTQEPATATVGTSIADKATIAGGSSPTGTVTFKLYSNTSATGTPLFTDTETLSAGIATSKSFKTTATGTDYWVDTYSGDTSNNTVASGAASEPVVITPVPTGELTGKSATAAASYNLTTLGTSDWADWSIGTGTATFDHKATGGSQISNVTKLGKGTFGGYSETMRTTSWTDGTPTKSDTADHAYLYAESTSGAGYSFTVPASTTAETLYIYLGGYSSSAKLTAHLSDSSAADYVTTVSSTNAYSNLATITYHAASAKQTLTLSYVFTAALNNVAGNIDLIAAWLTPAANSPANSPTVKPALAPQPSPAFATAAFTAAANISPAPALVWQQSADDLNDLATTSPADSLIPGPGENDAD